MTSAEEFLSPVLNIIKTQHFKMPPQPSVTSHQFLTSFDWLGYFGVFIAEIAQGVFQKVLGPLNKGTDFEGVHSFLLVPHFSSSIIYVLQVESSLKCGEHKCNDLRDSDVRMLFFTQQTHEFLLRFYPLELYRIRCLTQAGVPFKPISVSFWRFPLSMVNSSFKNF